jgi:glycosyltransferase involved in cell wall biosynthesis
MRIGIVAPVWCAVPPDGYGGTEQVLDSLARGLRDLGHDVVLAATGDSTCPVERVSVRPFPTATIGEQVPELQHVLFAYEQLADCDVVHDHTLTGPLLSVGRSSPPVVTTCHGDLCGELADWYRELAPYAPVIAISRSQTSAAPDLPLAVVHHGVVPEDFAVGAGDAGHLLFLGRMSPDKGAHRAARVARAAGMPLLIAAKMREPSEVGYFERCVRPLLGHGVDFVGEVAGIDKLELLAGAAALLMPIRWPEPFGMVMVEALACGTPVLAFAEGAAPEVVEHGRTGFLCRDETEMVQAVGRVPELSRLDCRRSVERRFSAARMARDHVAVYGSLLGGARLPDELHPLRKTIDLDAAVRLDSDVHARAPQRDAVH